MSLPNNALQIIERNHLGHFIYLPKKLGFDVKDINGVTSVNCSVKTSMFNIVYGASKNCVDIIAQIKKIYKGKPFAWWIPQSQHNPNMTKALLENGFIIETIEHAMICNLSHVNNFKQKTDLVIRQVTNIRMLADFMSVLELYDPCVSTFYENVNDALLQENETLVVGYACDKPVSIGVLFTFRDSAGIFSLITSENFKGKGYGTDMMIFMMNFAKEHGCQFVTLSASSDSGYRIYERLGFLKVGEFECFEYKQA